MTKVGMIGLSNGNGHPFSFSAIINGYSDSGLSSSGWKVIHEYVRQRDESEFGVGNMRVTHAWTQDNEQTERLCRACLIPQAVEYPEEMTAEVDAVIIARDDFETHYEMALPFLRAGLSVFVDKPLALDETELKSLKSYLESGQLMSCSGMRYARELDYPRAALNEYGDLRLIRGAIVLSWEHYGVHLIDAALNVTRAKPLSVTVTPSAHVSATVKMDDGSLLQIDALEESARTFRIDIWGRAKTSSHEITDNFSMFRRMLWHFGSSILKQRPAIPPEHTLNVMRVLIAGRRAQVENREVALSEIPI